MNKTVLKELHLNMRDAYSFTSNSYQNIQYGFFNGNKILFVGQNPGISQKQHSQEDIQLEYETRNYEEYLKEYEDMLNLDGCLLGKFIKNIYSDDWSNISFTNVYKNPFKNQVVDVKDNAFFLKVLDKQIRIIEPKLIVCIGAVARDAIAAINPGVKVVNLHHYAYLMRRGIYKNQVKIYKEIVENALY